MIGKDIDNLINEIKKLKESGDYIDPAQRAQIYRWECEAQSSYELDKAKPKQYVYLGNGEIIDFATGNPPDATVIKAIEGRVKQRLKVENRAGDDIIKKLSNSKLREMGS